MIHKCSECSTIFREKKNLHQHLRRDHGQKKYKCRFCDFRANNQHNLRKHVKVKHENFILKCRQCEYTTENQSNLIRHVRIKHTKKDLKCDQCNQYFATNQNMRIHVNAKHTLRSCNECNYTTYSTNEIKKHRNSEHEKDFTEKSAFNNLMYEKTWKVRGIKDPISTFDSYKTKVEQTINHYLKTKGPLKWYLGMQVIMQKTDNEGRVLQVAKPGFSANMKITGSMFNFNELYAESYDKIMKNFTVFNTNGSGWIFERVELFSIRMFGHNPIHTNEEKDNDKDDESNDDFSIY